ncbi:hypothetical protein BGZ46_001876, partial [Entomortierella lignicola]
MLYSRFASRDNVVIFIDGLRTEEKKTAQVRLTRSRTQLPRAKKIIDEMKANAKIGKAISNAKHKHCSRYLSQSVMLTNNDCTNLFNGLKKRGWDVVLGPGEADLAIRKRSSKLTRPFAVVTGDSDLLAHCSVPVIYRPFRGEFYEYDVDECAKALGILRLQLTALAIVSKNDYTNNPFRFGVATNLEIIKDMNPDTIDSILWRYRHSQSVYRRAEVDVSHFKFAYRVFYEGKECVIESDYDVKVKNHQAEVVAVRDHLKEAKDEMTQNAQARREANREHKAQSSNPFRHGKYQTFNRYRTIDQALFPQKPQVGTSKSSTADQSNLDRRKNYTCRYAVRRIVCSNPASSKPDREHPPMKLFRFKKHIEQDNTETGTEEEVKAKERKKWEPKTIPTNPHELQLKLKSAQERAIIKCIKDHVQVGNLIKRRAQIALAMYISKEEENGPENIRQAISRSNSSSGDMYDDDDDEFG